MSLIVHKARRVLKTHGIGPVIQRIKNEVLGTTSAYWGLKGQPAFEDIDSLIDFTNTAYHGLIYPIQVHSEFLSLLKMVRELKPRTVLEIGTARGGTLFCWTRVIPEDAYLISIDLPAAAGNFGDGYGVWRSPIYRSFARGRQRIDLLRGDSHSEAVIEKTTELLGRRQVDFLFIDAGHTYKDVKQDFEFYSRFVAPGGLIAFHDIALHPPSTGCEVSRFWSEIKPQYESGELIQDQSQGWAGIGYLRWNRKVTAKSSIVPGVLTSR